MIYRNAIVNRIPCTHVQLGHGDIGFFNAKLDGDPALCLVNLNEKKMAAEPIRLKPTIEEVAPQLIIRFSSLESLDIMIHLLMTMRNDHSK